MVGMTQSTYKAGQRGDGKTGPPQMTGVVLHCLHNHEVWSQAVPVTEAGVTSVPPTESPLAWVITINNSLSPHCADTGACGLPWGRLIRVALRGGAQLPLGVTAGAERWQQPLFRAAHPALGTPERARKVPHEAQP